MIRVLTVCIFALVAVTTPPPLAAQTFTEAEQGAMAQIEAETPLIHAMMLATGRYEDIVFSHANWLETMERDAFSGHDRAVWEARIAEVFRSEDMMLAFAASVDDLPLTPEVIAAGEAFYRSELAQRLRDTENEIGLTRIRDVTQYEAARASFAEIEGTQDPRALLIARLTEAFDMVEFLLDRGFDAEFAFLAGLRTGGYYIEDVSDDDLRESMEYDREANQSNAREYSNVYRMMMLDDFTVDEMTTYADFLLSPEGRVFADFTRHGSNGMFLVYRYAIGRVFAPIWIAQWEAEDAVQEAHE